MNISPENAFKEIKTISRDLFLSEDLPLTDRFFETIIDLFKGNYDGFQACDTSYHDLDHSLEVTLTQAKIISGWNKSQTPAVSKDFFDLGIMAALLHDIGYIKKAGDDQGTGAKYTFCHVGHSAEFACKLLKDINMDEAHKSAVENMIWHTCTKAYRGKIEYSSEEEKLVANALGTADLVGQMASPNYVGKLRYLYQEFEEAYQYEGIDNLLEKKHIIFESEEQLIKATPNFYYMFVKPALSSMGEMYKYIAYHYPDNVNHEIEQIEENMKKIAAAVDKTC